MKLALIALALLLPQLSHATDVYQIEADWNACLEKEENQNTHGMKTCNAEAFDAADEELNRTYQAIMKEYAGKNAENTEIRNRLRQAQRSWIPFRKSDCDLKGISMLGGSGEGVIFTGCLASTTIQRVKDLNELFGH